MKTLLSMMFVCLMGSVGLAGCVGGGGDESDVEVDDDLALEIKLYCGEVPADQYCIEEGDPYYPGGDGEPSCNECSYIARKGGYFYVCANGPGVGVTYHECEP